MSSASVTLDEAWAAVVGQPEAVAVLQASVVDPVHAYLFTGPTGSGKRSTARAFAGALVTPEGETDGRSARLALAGEHPDVIEIERVGASILKAQALDIVRAAAMSPVEGRRKVLILHEFHLLSAEGAAVLLKTIEEPAPSTVFLILADQMPPELVTIASRCVRVDFRPLTESAVRDALIAVGVDVDLAARAAASANGNLDRARLLASDPGLEERRATFAEAPHRLDGSGFQAVRTARALLDAIETAAEPLKARQTAEIASLDALVARSGERGAGRKGTEERHKRELRRQRADELRSGLTEIARTYRDALAAGGARFPDRLVIAVADLHTAMQAIDRNPNESLLLQALLLKLPSL
jgi:DNA polymerase III subunit delta'